MRAAPGRDEARQANPVKFDFVKKDTLPRASWLALVRKGEDRIEVFHGASVEEHDDFFFEGAWDGDFDAGGFDGAVTVLGSGGKLIADRSVVFATPSHIFERLYSLQLGDRLFVSNSLAFLLSRSGQELDEVSVNYAQTLYRKFGIEPADRGIPTKAGDPIRLYYGTNLRVRQDLEIEELPRDASAAFPDFGSYQEFLQSRVTGIFLNASDPNRSAPYVRPIAAISSGYDSTATAVLARSIGCADSITFTEARPLAIDHYESGSDSGRRIAERLGMSCQEIGRLDYLESQRRFPEAEVFATSHLVDLYILSLEESLNHQSVLFTGFRGDIMWNRALDTNQDSGGPGIAEFRIRLGFLHFPLPYLGTTDPRPEHCEVTRSIRRISNSEEMAPWMVGGDYDRPIPRRIVESAGVDRQAFGQAKKAVAVWYGKENPADIMLGDSYRDFLAFRSRLPGPEANHCFHWGIARIKDRYRL